MLLSRPSQSDLLGEQEEPWTPLLLKDTLPSESVPEDNLLASTNQKDCIDSPGLLASRKHSSRDVCAAVHVPSLNLESSKIQNVQLESDLLHIDDDTQEQTYLQELCTNRVDEAEDDWAKYRVVSVLGEGSYGKVYKVERVAQDPQPTARVTTKRKAVLRGGAPAPLVIKELQTDMMPKREALQALNEIDIHGQL